MSQRQGRLLTVYSVLLWLVMIGVAVMDEMGCL